VTSVIKGRYVIVCDRCKARMDLGPAHTGNSYMNRRLPTGWMATGPNEHVCTVCSPRYASLFRRVG
jgi:hypothetical protein